VRGSLLRLWGAGRGSREGRKEGEGTVPAKVLLSYVQWEVGTYKY